MLRVLTRSVRGKLLLVVGATALIALTAAGAALMAYDLRTYEADRIDDLHALAGVLGTASAPALAFNDAQGAQETLAVLRVRPSIIAGALHDARGKLYASYGEGLEAFARLAGTADTHLIQGDRIMLSKSIVEKGERIGTLYLLGRYEAGGRLLNYSLIVGAVVLLSLVLALVLTGWLQRGLTDPIVEITRAARRVMEHRDFSVRVRETSADEIGYLVGTFNAMLDEVGQRAAALEATNRQLTREMAERAAAEEARAESEERFRVLADHAPVLVWLNDESGCAFVNREYLAFTGCGMEELKGMAWTAVVHPDDLGAYSGTYFTALERRAQFEAEVRLRRADGNYRWFKSVGVPRFRSDGTLANYVGCSFDITEIKQTIAELDRAHTELRDADRRKDQFLAVLSHELRNPLNPIRTAAAVLQVADADPQKAKWAADIIERQAGQLARLLDDLLDAARIAQNKVELRLEVVDVARAVEMAIETTRPLIEGKQHRLETSLPPQPAYVKADPTRLAQVLGNILNNAAKYTDRGGRIELAVAERGGSVEVAIRDTGVGIAPENLASVFDMFTQLPDQSQLAAGGLGIGLALVRALVELQGGTVDARSDGPGKGSEFVVTFPSATHPALAQQRAGADPAPGTAGAGLRILVADDMPDSVQSLAIGLQVLGHRVVTARDGAQALEAASREPPDVAILDIGMPGMSGYEVASQIRTMPWGRAVTLVALTGWGQRADVHRARTAGFDHHITKPADFRALQSLLDAVVALRR